MSIEFIKRQAKQASKVLPEFLEQHSPPYSHALCLELVSRFHGYPNYHAAHTRDVRQEKQNDAAANAAIAGHVVTGPWWCDVCGGRIDDADDGYVVFQSQDQYAFGFLVIHQTRCDPRGEYDGSMALKDLLGGLGLSRLLSFLAVGPLMASAMESTNLRVQHLEEFIDLLRRMQVPGYETARRHFDDPVWRDRLGGWNEIAAYDPKTLANMLTWDVSEAPGDAAHLGLVGVLFRGTARLKFPDGYEETCEVKAAFDPTMFDLRPESMEGSILRPEGLTLPLCADGVFRSSLVDDDGETVGAVTLRLSETSGTDPHRLEGEWEDEEGRFEFTVVLDTVQ